LNGCFIGLFPLVHNKQSLISLLKKKKMAVRQLITELFSFLHTIAKIWTESGYSGPELSDWLWHPIRMPDRGRYKQSFPASTCYLVDGWLKEPLLG